MCAHTIPLARRSCTAQFGREQNGQAAIILASGSHAISQAVLSNVKFKDFKVHRVEGCQGLHGINFTAAIAALSLLVKYTYLQHCGVTVTLAVLSTI